jgi:hypothetical protein
LFEKIISYFLRPEFPVDLEAMTRKVAELCYNEVCQSVAGRMEGMSLSEARGYVRSRGSQVAVCVTQRVLLGEGIVDEELTDLVARSAVERIIPRAIREAQVGVPSVRETRLAA